MVLLISLYPLQLRSGDNVEKHSHNLVLFGLTLCSATWNPRRSCLSPLHVDAAAAAAAAANKKSYCAVISFKLEAEPHSRTPSPCPGSSAAEGKKVQLNCPVLLANRTSVDAESSAGRQPLFHVPLALSSEMESGSEKVYLTCDSEYHDAYL
jgi:hypothetical protein